MTLANIQNMVIRQGPVQRLFGVSDLVVHTAGGGAASEAEDAASGASGAKNLHVGHIRGLANPGDVRDRIQRRLRALGGTGLGDEDAVSSTAPSVAATSDPLNAARQVLGEVEALRRDLARPHSGEARGT